MYQAIKALWSPTSAIFAGMSFRDSSRVFGCPSSKYPQS